MDHELQSVPGLPLPFVELNAASTATIVLVHGALSSPLEMSLVTPYLSRFHLLIPAYHNMNAQDPRPPFSISETASQIAALIRRRAKDGQADVFGLSLGGFVVLELATKHVETVRTVIASGITLFSRFPKWKSALLPGVLYSQSVLPKVLLSKSMQASLINKFLSPASNDYATQVAALPNKGDWTLTKAIAHSMTTSLLPDRPIAIEKRVLVVAGTSSEAGFPDPIDDARRVLQEVKKHNEHSRGVEIVNGAHPWIVQWPKLCADLIQAWIAEDGFPDGVREIVIE